MISSSGQAQSQNYKLTPLPLSDLQSFATPGKNWKIVEGVKGSYTDAEPKTKKGTGVLYNDFNKDIQFKSEANLVTGFEHSDIFLSMDFLMPKGSNSGIYFQGRYEIQLFDSWRVKTPHSVDCGSIYERWDDSKPEGSKGFEGHPPRANASLAPNVWQHLEVEFQAPRFDANGKKISPARFVKVTLNGIIIHENVVLTGPTRASAFTDEKAKGPIVIQGDHGPVAFRNIEYALLNDFDVKISDLTYEYYEGRFNNFDEATKDKLTRSGEADAIDFKLADNPNELVLSFSGKLTLAEASRYQFIVKKIGNVKMTVDGEEIIKPTGVWGDGNGNKQLSAGEHTFTFSYRKNFSWAPSGFGLFIGKENSRPILLSTSGSQPRIAPTPLITTEADGSDPKVIRSFMFHDGKKKTHVISVGYPSGIHYAYDLKQGGLLKVWRGDFLDVTEMWHERGEPQIASPMGSPISFADRAALAIVQNDKSSLPDTLGSELVYKGYVLNDKFSPMFQYQYGSMTFDDLIQPSSDGLGFSRSLSIQGVNANQVTYVRLAQGSAIEKVGDNTFAVDNQQYFIQLPVGSKIKYEIKESPGKQELVVPISGTSKFEFLLIW